MKQFIKCPECGMPILATISINAGIPEPYGKQYFFKCEYCECEGFDYDVELAKAISIKQPWSYLIASGVKDIENRTWKTNFRGRVLIHACANPVKYTNLLDILSLDQWDNILRNVKAELVFRKLGNCTNSAIIGSVEIADCVINHESIWAEKTGGPGIYPKEIEDILNEPVYNWVLANPVLFEKPVLNVKGKLSFFIPEIN